MAWYLFSVLLLISVTSASHYYGGFTKFTPKGRNSNGFFQVDLHYKQTYRSCSTYTYWGCYHGNCGFTVASERGVIDSSSHSPAYTNGWCETEIVETRYLPSDNPIEIRKASCCWIYNVNYMGFWKLLTHMDLRRRSDTSQSNNSPNNAILPFLRVPSNCPRSYDLMTVDPDGDQVVCRYGSFVSHECATCSQPSGFHLDEGNCILHYKHTSYTGVYGFELVVEDFPSSTITLTSTNGSQTSRLTHRHKRALYGYGTTVHYPGWWTTTNGPKITTSSPTTPSASWSGWPTPTPSSTTSSPTTSSAPWWWPTPTPSSTTSSPTTSSAPWWWPTPTPHSITQHPTKTTTATTSTTNPWRTTTRKRQTAPLSKLPLQFSLLVDSAAPSCYEGVYLPKFVHPTPYHKELLKAEANQQFEITVKAQASHSIVGDIIFSGPLNTTKHNISPGQFDIRWTPTEDHLGKQVPICFIAEAAFSYQNFQSEMRCILVDVANATTAHVICNETSMTVEVDKSYFKGLSEDHLRLNDPSSTACSFHSNGTHIIGVIPLNACGTQIKEDVNNLIFNNEITTYDDVGDIITRKHLLEIQFSCQYPKHGNVTLGYTFHRENTTVVEKGFGTFTYNFEFYPDNFFGTMVDASSYPLVYDVGETIYMQIEATTSVNNTELFVESCRASPYDNPNYQPTYSMIEGGCIVDPTLLIYSPSHNKEFRFSIDAFKFIGLHDQVYISCSVILCEAGNPDTRCSKGCVPPTHVSRRRKRAALIETGAHLISQGPLRLRGKQESRVTGLNLNLAFIAGCLLAATAMISGVMIYKFKRADVQYQPLPTIEH